MPRLPTVLAASALGLLLASASPLPAASRAAPTLDPSRDLPRVPPREPGEAPATWRVRPGFRLELAAHEPQVASPIAVAFDERGRMFVCEMIDYPEQREVRPHLGRVARLEDRDGDGHFETRTTFADNLPWPTGLICSRGGVYVVATPDILFLRDRDDDGAADERLVAFTGFNRGHARLNVQTLPNSLQWGLDARIHLQTGGGNRGVVSSPLRPDLPGVELAGRDFWFDPLTHAFGFESGGGQYGMSYDAFGRRFACSNSDHLQLHVYEDALASPGGDLPGPRTSIAADGGAAEVYRISPDEPWRIVRTRWRVGGVVQGLIEGGGRVSGYFTGATGTTFYRGDAFGPGFPASTFTGDAGGQLVHRKLITPDGASFLGRRAPDERDREFAASTDPWVRVVGFANAPDGTLYFCDMYREVIEHPWSIPETIKQHLDLTSGRMRGRIYRLVPDDPAWRRRAETRLADAAPEALVALLDHANGWHRETAARLLYENHRDTAVPALAAAVRAGRSPEGRALALGVLQGWEALGVGVLEGALRDPDPGVRERAVAAAARRTPLEPSLVPAMVALAGDPVPRVRLYATLAATRLPGDARTALLATAALRDAADPWIGPAVIHGADAALLRRIRDQLDHLPSPWVGRLLGRLAATVPSSAPDLERDLRLALSRPGVPAAWIRAVGEGWARAGRPSALLTEGPALRPVFAAALTTAQDASAAEERRREALALVGLLPRDRARPALRALLGSGTAAALQVAAVETAGRFAAEDDGALLLDCWPTLKPEARQAALGLLRARAGASLALLEAIASGRVLAGDLPAADIDFLWRSEDPAVGARARAVLAAHRGPTPERSLALLRPALDLAGEVERGRLLFEQRCQFCHRAAGRGVEVGPDLETVRGRGRDGLLEAIVDPHREVAPAYVAYTVTTRDGNRIEGVIRRDDASGMTLRLMGGAEVTLARAEIAGTTSGGRSLMPEGLEQGLAPGQVADLLTFIESLGHR